MAKKINFSINIHDQNFNNYTADANNFVFTGILKKKEKKKEQRR